MEGGGHFLFVRIFRFMIQYSELQYNLIDEEENSTEISNPTLLVSKNTHKWPLISSNFLI